MTAPIIVALTEDYVSAVKFQLLAADAAFLTEDEIRDALMGAAVDTKQVEQPELF
jgi:hypothetical protein